MKDNKDNSRHLGRKYARIFVFVHYLFLVAHSFPRASLPENCSLLGTDNVRGQISEHIFSRQIETIVYMFRGMFTTEKRRYNLNREDKRLYSITIKSGPLEKTNK